MGDMEKMQYGLAFMKVNPVNLFSRIGALIAVELGGSPIVSGCISDLVAVCETRRYPSVQTYSLR